MMGTRPDYLKCSQTPFMCANMTGWMPPQAELVAIAGKFVLPPLLKKSSGRILSSFQLWKMATLSLVIGDGFFYIMTVSQLALKPR